MDHTRLTLVIIAVTALFAADALTDRSFSATPAVPLPPLAPNAADAAAAASEYRIGPGDQLQVFVWNHPELSQTVPVRPDGQISTPLVERISAVNKTPSELALDLEQVLGEYVRSPKVNIIVTRALGTLSQVQVVGQVVKPQSIPYHAGMKVLDLLLQVGGLSQYAAGNRAKIVRQEPGARKEIQVKLDRLVNRGDMSQNLDVRPGDVLIVPQSLF